MTIEQRMDQLEKRNKRLTIALARRRGCVNDTAQQGRSEAQSALQAT